MNDTSERISALKIDRSTAAPSGGGFRWSLLVPAVLIVVVLGWWFVLRPGAGAVVVETDTARRPPSIAAASSVLDASGYVVARRQATVSSELTGKVKEVLIEEGMRVEEGQVVAYLDDATQQAQVALASAQAEAARAALAEVEAQLRAARLERDRLREMAERELTSVASLDSAEAVYDALAAKLDTGRENVEVALSNVALARDALDNMTIRAPFAGMVVSKNAQPGEMISPISAGGGFTRTGICTIVDMDSLEIEVDVNEAYMTGKRQLYGFVSASSNATSAFCGIWGPRSRSSVARPRTSRNRKRPVSRLRPLRYAMMRAARLSGVLATVWSNDGPLR
jgi:multidrug efflux pump subunit AcrA (membrane-fusion protein)